MRMPKPEIKNEESTIFRDHLAEHRTELANDRTLLAYVRTSLTFFVAGVSFIKFFDNIAIEIVGWIFLPAAIATFAAGVVSYRRVKHKLKLEFPIVEKAK